MKKILAFIILAAFTATAHADNWPDGTPMDKWFSDTSKVDVSTLGQQYVVTDYGVSNDSTIVQTQQLQAVIDKGASEGGGVVVIPRGTFLSGSLFFKPGTHLHIAEGGKLKGSDRIANFKIIKTRIEGETCDYFAALVNADHVDGFTITGNGTIDGNGYNYWEEFWIRRKWNRKCTNKDAQRPRLVYISNSSNVTVQDVRIMNSAFWTNHIYNSDHVRYLDCFIYAPTSGMKAPSSDAIDIDKCHDILINGCYMNVNDDAVVLKGGKGIYADSMSVNGPVERVLVQNCHYGTVHSMLTLGSESVHDWNVIVRNCRADDAYNVLWLKMRPDTPQHYEHVRIENLTGHCRSFLLIKPWTQFFQMGDRADMPKSECNDIRFHGIRMECGTFFDVSGSEKYVLRRFEFSDVEVTDRAAKPAFTGHPIEGLQLRNVRINGADVSP